MAENQVCVVSVIIPAYNARAYIAESIQSVLSQSFNDLEVLVVDNNSTDGTEEIAEQFQDPRIHVLKCNRQSAAAARNVGIRNANGTYIQFLDSDDVLDPQKIERQLIAIGFRDPVRTVASCAWLRFEADALSAGLLPEPVWEVEDPVDWLICSLSGGGMMQTGAWLVHHELIKAAGPWDETLSLHDDGEFFTRVLLQAECQVFVTDAKIYYRTVAGSLSRRRDRSSIESAFRVCQLRDMYLLDAVDNNRVRVAVATQYAQFAYEFSLTAPDLARQALIRIEELGEKPANSVGGALFRQLAGILGFRFSLGLRKSIAQLLPARA